MTLFSSGWVLLTAKENSHCHRDHPAIPSSHSESHLWVEVLLRAQESKASLLPGWVPFCFSWGETQNKGKKRVEENQGQTLPTEDSFIKKKKKIGTALFFAIGHSYCCLGFAFACGRWIIAENRVIQPSPALPLKSSHREVSLGWNKKRVSALNDIESLECI